MKKLDVVKDYMAIKEIIDKLPHKERDKVMEMAGRIKTISQEDERLGGLALALISQAHLLIMMGGKKK